MRCEGLMIKTRRMDGSVDFHMQNEASETCRVSSSELFKTNRGRRKPKEYGGCALGVGRRRFLRPPMSTNLPR